MAVNLAESSSPVIAIADRDSEETESDKDVEETVEVVSLLERLKDPKRSDLSRKRNEALVVSAINRRLFCNACLEDYGETSIMLQYNGR